METFLICKIILIKTENVISLVITLSIILISLFFLDLIYQAFFICFKKHESLIILPIKVFLTIKIQVFFKFVEGLNKILPPSMPPQLYNALYGN